LTPSEKGLNILIFMVRTASEVSPTINTPWQGGGGGGIGSSELNLKYYRQWDQLLTLCDKVTKHTSEQPQ